MPVPAVFPIRGRAAQLMGRSAECAALDRLLEAVRAGESRALVVHGEAGVGKTALLEYLASQASGCRVERAVGVQSEMELAFAGLHQLCAPMLDRLGRLPAPQRDALRTAFGMSSGPAPDRFLVALAVLGLLSEVAGERPVICLVDDEQWLDHASAQALGFVARRLGAESIGLVFGARGPTPDLAGLPELEVGGLGRSDARALLDLALAVPIDARVRDQIVAETQGNPLALLELPRGLTPSELAGGFGLPGAAPLPERIEESFRRQLDALPAETGRLLLLAAAEPYGDLSLIWRAAAGLGIPIQAAAPAIEAGLVTFGTRVRFRHPLTRSASYRAASVSDRQAVHRALAEATDAAAEPERRAWHRAQAAAGPDEEVAAELERSAGRAQARGGLAAAAAFLERSVLLTVEPERRVDRTLAAARANLQAGAFGTALELVAAAEDNGSGPLDELQSAQVDLLRGEIVFASGLGSDAPPLLLKAAKRLESLDLELARETYLGTWGAALFAGRLTGSGDLLEVSRAARALPPLAHPRRGVDLLLDGLALLTTDGPAAAAPMLRQAASTFASSDALVAEGLRWGWIAYGAASTMWDDDGWHAILLRQVGLARRAGALDHLPILLGALAMAAVWRGDLAGAASLIVEADAATEATGSRIAPYAAMLLASVRGNQDEAAPLIEATIAVAPARGQGAAATYAHWVAAILGNGLGHYEEALAAARQASEDRHLYVSTWVLPELIEAAARSGNTHMAGDALDRLAETTRAGGTDCGLGIQARSRALLSDGEAADGLYCEAIDRLGRTQFRLELARAHLLYGEWLRRQRRRADACEQLRTAHGMLEAMGAAGFAERARRELRATGQTARKRTAATADRPLTAQEAQIARLARDGLSNPEIASRLFISARTVQYHLGKVFAKLGITSRSQLSHALP